MEYHGDTNIELKFAMKLIPYVGLKKHEKTYMAFVNQIEVQNKSSTNLG